ncbi:MAG: hypothetical protein PHQ86_08645 [Dehalococcoidales bacterium]|nr:hypothetical protein [Dehalococcoidales bacterium]
MKQGENIESGERIMVETVKIVEVVKGVATEKSIEVMKEVSKKKSQPDRYIVFDDTKCNSCMLCMLNCSLAHEGKTSLSLSRIQVIVNPLERFPLDIMHKWNHEKNTAMKCDFCIDTPYWEGNGPACVKACPMQAITVTSEIPTQLGE